MEQQRSPMSNPAVQYTRNMLRFRVALSYLGATPSGFVRSDVSFPWRIVELQRKTREEHHNGLYWRV